jgi:hypothetical protein
MEKNKEIPKMSQPQSEIDIEFEGYMDYIEFERFKAEKKWNIKNGDQAKEIGIDFSKENII